MKIEDLKHVEVPIDNGVEGANVLVLDTGALISAEDQAMLMALHSRNPAGVRSHLAKLAQAGSGEFMDRFYVGYGHGSIGDCGNTAVFVEGVSMLAAKAIQDSALYAGQECSTRYIDFSNQPFLNPETGERAIQIDEAYAELRSFYLNSFGQVVEDLKRRYPDSKKEGEVWEKAINARAFDILRGFLPAGATTNVAWNTNLRQARDRLLVLRNHPLAEVRTIAESLEQALKQHHPHSFGGKRYEETEDYMARVMQEDYYLEGDEIHIPRDKLRVDADKLDARYLKRYEQVLRTRPNSKTELPKFLAQAGTIDIRFLLDFGSFRDIQRHRATTIRMPLHSTYYGMEPWYINELPEDIQGEARRLSESIDNKFSSPENIRGEGRLSAQYGIPMGYLGACAVTGDLPAIVYLLELRSTTPVHPTLRAQAIEASRQLTGRFVRSGIGLALFPDMSDSKFDTTRGLHDIVERKVA